MYRLSEDKETVAKINERIDSMWKEFEEVADEFFKENPDVLEKSKGET